MLCTTVLDSYTKHGNKGYEWISIIEELTFNCSLSETMRDRCKWNNGWNIASLCGPSQHFNVGSTFFQRCGSTLK